MTATKQCFITYNGDNQEPIFTVYADAACTIPLDISDCTEITLQARRDLSSPIVLTKTKTGGGIVFNTDGKDGLFKAIIVPADTAGLAGFYFMWATVTDAVGEISTISLIRWNVGPTPVWTYSGDPSTSTRDAVRTYIGDTDYSNQLFTDAALDGFIRDNGSVLYAAAAACMALSIRFAMKVDKKVGDLSISYGAMSKNFASVAADLRAQAAVSGSAGAIYAAGTSKSDMASYVSPSNPDANGAFTTLNEFNNNGPIGGIIATNAGGGDEV